MKTVLKKKSAGFHLKRYQSTAISMPHLVLMIFLVQALIITPLPADEYDDFNRFCIENYTAEKEIEMYNREVVIDLTK